MGVVQHEMRIRSQDFVCGAGVLGGHEQGLHGADVVVRPLQITLGRLISQPLGGVVADQSSVEVGSELDEHHVTVEDLHAALDPVSIFLKVQPPHHGEDEVDPACRSLLEDLTTKRVVEPVELGCAVTERLDEGLDGHVIVEQAEVGASTERPTHRHLSDGGRTKQHEQHENHTNPRSGRHAEYERKVGAANPRRVVAPSSKARKLFRYES